jgi:hypothetical protein
LTDKAVINWEIKRKQFVGKTSHPYVLLKIIKLYNPTYYNEIKMSFQKRNYGNVKTWFELVTNINYMSQEQIRSAVLRTVIKNFNNSKLNVIYDDDDIRTYKHDDFYDELCSDRRIFVKECNEHKSEGNKKVRLSHYIREYLYDYLPCRYDDNELLVENLIREPKNYMRDEVVAFLKDLSLTYKHKEDYIYDMARDSRRFNNGLKNPNIIILLR